METYKYAVVYLRKIGTKTWKRYGKMDLGSARDVVAYYKTSSYESKVVEKVATM